VIQERRIRQQAEETRKEAETCDKIAARAFAQSYLADLVPSVFGLLSDNGYFHDPVERGNRDLLRSFRTSLQHQVINHCMNKVTFWT